MSLREPVRAGSFYPGQAEACQNELTACIPDSFQECIYTEKLVGGVVPHAGWMFSGAVAGGVFAALARPGTCATYLLFGASHGGLSAAAALFGRGSWRSPLGDVDVDESLADQLLGSCPDLVADEQAHSPEHSLEVQVPFIQRLSPQARIVPILVLPTAQAVRLGRDVGRTVAALRQDVLFVGSSDLTHYGPRYGFEPAGSGPEGLKWAREVNDRRMIDCLLAMQAEEIVPEAAQHQSACGAGALAATAAACRECGARKGILLDHRTSLDVEGGRDGFFGGPPADAVGYAGVVFA